MKMNFPLLAILFAVVSFTAGATEIFVDTDNDKVPDWEDYCPNTPPGKTVWTLETVKAAKGDPRWVGCTENERPPSASFVPPSRESVLAGFAASQRRQEEERKASLVRELDAFNRNLAYSFEQMAKSSPKSKALVYRKAALLIHANPVNAVAALCANRLLMDITLPLLQTQSAKVFETTIIGAKELTRLLAQSLGNRCETLEKNDPIPSLRTELELLQSGGALWPPRGLVEEIATGDHNQNKAGCGDGRCFQARLQRGPPRSHRHSRKSQGPRGISRRE